MMNRRQTLGAILASLLLPTIELPAGDSLSCEGWLIEPMNGDAPTRGLQPLTLHDVPCEMIGTPGLLARWQYAAEWPATEKIRDVRVTHLRVTPGGPNVPDMMRGMSKTLAVSSPSYRMGRIDLTPGDTLTISGEITIG